MDTDQNRVVAMLRGRHILITGGTGFMGKVLIEKILRFVPDIGRLYLLVRPKKGREPHSRIADIFANPLFDKLKAMRGLDILLAQCTAIAGDCAQLGLAISAADRQLIADNVSIIYHCAATIRFDEPLRNAVLLNTRGTKLVLELAGECKHLALMAHVSTSYCHLHEKLLLEKPYPPPTDPHKIIRAVEWMDDEVANSITPQVLGSVPNTYAYTKCLSEALVNEHIARGLPAMIFRPSIVIPIRYDPIPGWTDNINGPTGLLIGAGKGVIRSMYCNSSSYGDFLPVDFAVNGMLVGAWNYIANGDTKRSIVHMTSSADIKVSWNQVVEMGRWIVCNKLPLNGGLWYPGGSMKSSRLHHNVCSVLYHWIPAYLIDALLFCIGYPPVLCRVHRRIQKGFDVFEYYANNQWDFDNANIVHTRTIMNAVEKKHFPIEDTDIDMIQYFEDCIRAARRYMLNQADDTIPAAQRHMTMLYWLDRISKFIIYSLIIYFVGGFVYKLVFR